MKFGIDRLLEEPGLRKPLRKRQGLLVRDAGNSYLTAEGVDGGPDSPRRIWGQSGNFFSRSIRLWS